MDNMNYENKILDAVQLLVDSAISKAKYDKTIQGVIVKCTDETKGQYVVSYQNSSFYAYSTDTSSIFNAGTAVYVLIPESDMSQTKTILGSVNRLGTDYINLIDVSNDFQIIGNSVVTSEDEIGVKSLLAGGDSVILYDKDDIEHALVDVNTVAADTYFKQTNYLVLGGDFRTNLPSNQKYQGDYGLIAELVFKDNITDDEVTRTYVLNLNDMEGMPYNFSNPTSQKLIFEIDGQNFIEVKKLQFYCINFPHSQANPAEDIFISNIRLEGANRLEGDELEGNSLTFTTPAGIYFDDNDSSTAEREVNAVLRVDGKIVTADSAGISYYWFKENFLINTSSPNYNRYGGVGWECLNNYNTVETNVKEWISASSQYITKKQNNIAKETAYKCVVLYNGIALSKTFNIYNYSSDYDVQIASDSGTYFMCDNGRPTLTCSVNNSTTGDYTYVWGMINNNGKYSTIAETTDLNTIYHTTKNRYDQLVSGLADGSILLTNDIETELNTKRAALQGFATTMRVEDNVIYNLTLNLVVNFAYITCAVFSDNAYIGKSKILITNDLNVGTSPYSLVINNGDQVFKYNEQGVSPASPALDNPQQIFPLTFSLYDEQGKEIDQAAISATNVFWTLPTTDTMIEVVGAGSSHSEDTVNNTITYFGSKTLIFKIPTLYQVNKTRNSVQLLVKYKDKIAVANTDLTFIKEGETGSNGTNYICRIVPNLAVGSVNPVYPIYRYNNTTQSGSLNYTPGAAGRWFKAELYKDGVQIFSSPTSANSTEGRAVTLKWEILKNKYTSSVSDSSNFAVNSSEEFSFVSNNINTPANIVKCTITYDGQTYYTTMPLIFVDAAAAFKVDLVENTGFLSAMYTADGKRPSYDNAKPFKLKVIENISGTDTDVSIATGNKAVTYSWNVKGSIYDGTSFTTNTNLIEKTIVGETLAINEKRYQPIDSFDGLCVSNSLLCEITRGNTLLAKIYIPIHLYLNKYGNSAMNGWDGNSIEINNDGGFILAPQVGAGKKEQDNSYTGIFMGDIREAGAANNEVGLFGYQSGVRTLELNAEDGSAKFGKTGAGQIVIAPGAGANKGTARLYSSDYDVGYILPSNLPAPYGPQTTYVGGYSYWRRNAQTGNYTLLKAYEGSGTPGANEYRIGDTIAATDYVWWGGSGLEIDLNDPHIRFGSGKFRIDSDGQVYATGFATVMDLEQGTYNIPGTEKFKADYITDTVQIETNADHYPASAVDETIVCKCYYKDVITSNYTATLVNSSGTPITNNTTSTGGLTVTVSKSGTDTTIRFVGQTTTQITNAINEYFVKFTHSTETALTTTKAFYANLVIQGQDGQPGEQGPAGPPGADGTSIIIKGSYDTIQQLIAAHPSGNTLGDAYVIGLNLYVYTNAAGGSGSNPGDWNDVGQFKGEDAKFCFIIASSEVFKKTGTATTYTPNSITLTPLTQAVTISNWAYSINGGGSWTTLSSPYPTGISINSDNVLTITNNCSLFTNSVTSLVFKCTTSDINVYDTMTITRIADGKDGSDGKGISSITNFYLATNLSENVTRNTPGWQPTVQSTTASNKYLWNYETISYNNGTSTSTDPVIIGMFSQDGENGRGISSITEFYAINNDADNPPADGAFSDSVVNPTASERFLWNFERIEFSDSSTPHTTEKRIIGTYGDKGDTGKGIRSTAISYQELNSGSGTPPSTGWDPNPPTTPTLGKYLWTRTIVTYSDDTTTTSYAIAYRGTNGTNGTSITITSQNIKYGYNQNGTSYADIPASRSTQNPGGWGDTIPDTPDGYYLWTRTTVNYSDSSSTISYTVSYQSQDATQYYTYVRYASSATPAAADISENSEGKTYIGVAVTTSNTAPTTYTSYIWTKFVGDDATQYYTYIRYSENSTGSGMVEIPTATTKYVGIYVGTSSTVPAYTEFNWSKFIGEDGKDTTNIVCGNEAQIFVCGNNGKVSAATSVTIPFAGYVGNNRLACTVSYSTLPSGMTLTSNTPASASADGSLIFAVAANATLGGTSITNGTIDLTFTCNNKTFIKKFTWAKSIKGNAGADAYTVVLSNESHTFPATTTAAVASSTTVNVIAYKGASSITPTIGTITGQVTGLTTSVSGTTITINAATTLTTTSGVLTIPITVDGKSFTKKFSWSLAKAGNGINTVTNYYLATSASSGVTRETTGWTTTIQTMTETNKYLWTYEDTLYTSGDHGYTDPSIIGVYGTHGTGISAITEYYAISNSSTTAPADSEFDTSVKVPTSSKKYLWNYEKIDYINPTSSVNTAKHVVGNYSADGTSPTAYSLIISHAAIVKTKAGTYSPAAITLTAKSQTGNAATQNFTTGRYAIFLNGSSTASTTVASSAGYSYTIPANTTSVRVALYNSSTGTTILDEQTIPIVTDGTDGEDGSGVWTATAAPTTPNYTFTISSLTGMNTRTPMVGDIVVYSYYRYTITSIDTTAETVLTGNRQSIRGATGAAAYTAYLTNESQTLVYGTAQTVTTQLYGFGGTTSKTVQIKSVNGVTATTTNTNTGITGIKFKVSSTSAATGPTITFTTTTDLPQSTSGAIPIVFRITDDSADRTINFTYSTTTRGQAGTNASLVDITASSQVFKSTDGGLTFSPDTIVLTPRFQTVTYSKWYYIINGGTPQQITSGQHGLTISSGVLTISKSCDLYTDSITSITFKCESSNASVYDTMTVLKLYDVTEIQIGGRNLLKYTRYGTLDGVNKRGDTITTIIDTSAESQYRNNNTLKITCTTPCVSGSKDIWQKCWTNQIVGQPVRLSLYVKGSVTAKAWFRLGGSNSSNGTTTGTFNITTNWQKLDIDLGTVTTAGTSGQTEIIYGFDTTGIYYVNSMMLEYGTLASEWSAAPEDSQTISLIKYMTTSTSTAPDKNASEWMDNRPSAGDLFIWEKDGIQNVGSTTVTWNEPVCIYTPSGTLSSLEYCLCSSSVYADNKIISGCGWRDTAYEWLNTYVSKGETFNTLQVNTFQFVRNKYQDSYDTEKDIIYSDPVLDNNWLNFGKYSYLQDKNIASLNSTTNNTVFKATASDGVYFYNGANTNRIHIDSRGINFGTYNSTTGLWEEINAWNIDGTLRTDLIKVSTINAENIQSGTLSLTDTSTLEAGVIAAFVLNSSQRQEIAKITTNGVVVTNDSGDVLYMSAEYDKGFEATALGDATPYFKTSPRNKTTTMYNTQIDNSMILFEKAKIVPTSKGFSIISYSSNS